MRTLLLCSLMFLIPLIADAQEKEKKAGNLGDEFLKEFEDDQSKAQSEFDSFNDSINQDYINLIVEGEKEFSELLQGSFKEFKEFMPEIPPVNIKPEKVNISKLTPPQTIAIRLKEKKISVNGSQAILIPPHP